MAESVGLAAHLVAPSCHLSIIAVRPSDVHACSLHAVKLSSNVLLQTFLVQPQSQEASNAWLVACHTGMNACISVGKLAEARQLLQDMKQRNITLDIRVFNILLKGYSRRGGMSAVPGILQEMADADLKPSAVTYNTLIDTYVTAGQLAQARQTCADAQAAGAALSQLSLCSKHRVAAQQHCSGLQLPMYVRPSTHSCWCICLQGGMPWLCCMLLDSISQGLLACLQRSVKPTSVAKLSSVTWMNRGGSGCLELQRSHKRLCSEQRTASCPGSFARNEGYQ